MKPREIVYVAEVANSVTFVAFRNLNEWDVNYEQHI